MNSSSLGVGILNGIAIAAEQQRVMQVGLHNKCRCARVLCVQCAFEVILAAADFRRRVIDRFVAPYPGHLLSCCRSQSAQQSESEERLGLAACVLGIVFFGSLGGLCL